MGETKDFHYDADPNEPLSLEVVTAIAKAHNEDIIDQKWQISNDINTDALDGLFQDNKLDTILEFKADTVTVYIVADKIGNPVIKIESHR